MTDGFLALAVGVALTTYLTRVAGYLLMARMTTIPRRVAAGLEAVPVAVMTTLFAPQIVAGGWREAAAMGVALVASLRFGATSAMAIAALALIGMRSTSL